MVREAVKVQVSFYKYGMIKYAGSAIRKIAVAGFCTKYFPGLYRNVNYAW